MLPDACLNGFDPGCPETVLRRILRLGPSLAEKKAKDKGMGGE